MVVGRRLKKNRWGPTSRLLGLLMFRASATTPPPGKMVCFQSQSLSFPRFSRRRRGRTSKKFTPSVLHVGLWSLMITAIGLP